jgi:hypothetical protein
VIIGGRVVLQDGTWKTLDPASIAEDLQRTSGRAAHPDDSIGPLKASVREYYRRSVPLGSRLYTYNDGE